MTFLKSTIILGLSLTLLACGGGSDDPNSGKAADDAGVNSDGTDDVSNPPKAGTKDAGGSAVSTPKDPGGSTGGAKDAGASKTESRDGGASASAAKDGAASGDASKPAADGDKGKDAGGDDFMIPDLFPDEPDAGGSTSTPSTGPRDVNGPCKDLELLCFDVFDMFIINPDDCVTCNGGKGCEGCAIPYAY